MFRNRFLKILSSFLVFLLVFNLFSFAGMVKLNASAKSDDIAGVTVTIGDVTVGKGLVEEIPVTINTPVSGIAAYGLKINYDSNVLEVLDIIPNDSIGDYFVSNTSEQEDRLAVVWVDMTGGDSPISTATELFKIKVKVKSDAELGNSALTIDKNNIENFNFYDSELQDIQADLVNGKINVVNSYNVKFEVVNGSEVDSQIIMENGKVGKPANPTRDGYTFAGWYTTESFTTEFDFTTVINEPKILYARWISDLPNANINLSNLELSAGSLSPTFAMDTEIYTVNVENSLSSIKVTPTVADNKATVTVNGLLVESGKASRDINLNVGENNITIVVTAEDGSTKTYGITVMRAPAQTSPVAPNVTKDDLTNKLLGADSTMEYSTDGGGMWTGYDPDDTPTFNGNVTVQIRVRASGSIPAGAITTLTFTKNPTSSSDNNNGGQSTSSSNIEKIVVDVDGKNGTNLTKTPITRTTDSNGKVKDHVSMSEDIAKETVQKAKQQGTDTARIIIPDTNDKVSEVVVEIPKSALKQLNDGQLKLEIATDNAIISIPTKSLSTFSEDLYFRVVPIKMKELQKQVEERAKKEQVIQEIAKNQNVQIIGRPMEIDTNMQSREVSILLPLKEDLPKDSKARDELLKNLVIFVEHSDGTKEVVRGKVVPYKNNSDLGLEFTISKFSTFSIVYMDGAKAFFDGKVCGSDKLPASAIGCLSIKKSLPVYELVNNRLKKVDSLKKGQAAPAYENISPMLGLGGEIWVERTNSIRYETPSRTMLDKNSLTGSSRTKQIWKGLELHPGQIGKIKVMEDTVVWEKINKTIKLARVLKKGEQYRVYRNVPSLYSIGDGKYIVQNEQVILQNAK
ncbi:DUF4073 domain-containing protein [Psychrobacillus sp. NPDC058041]|uniref:DUF4073 domain-containing protein n=1 Tax=Psychrobacillus sp. NPDC058041 TaxID=3346310 RepID=UPI0036DCC387